MTKHPLSYCACGIALVVSGIICSAQRLPVGQTLEVRLLSVTGSKASKAGDPVEAVVISPVIHQGRLALPAGVSVRGSIKTAEPLGLGFKRQTAKLAYQFDRLVLPNGEQLPVETRLRVVDTAREKVDAHGGIHGIRPTTNVSSTLAVYAWRLAYLEPMVALPVWGAKFLFARAPDPEIRYPAGTELVLELTAEIDLSSVMTVPNRVQPLSGADLAAAYRALSQLGVPQAFDKNGKASDRVNVILIASEAEIKRAFAGSGWTTADRRSIKSIFRTYSAVVQRMGYSRAPVNNLLLGGHDPALVVQKSLNTFSKRHHGRIWRGPVVDGERRLWLMAATEDVGIHLNWKRMRFTHVSDPRVESERAKIVTDLSFTQCIDSAALIRPGDQGDSTGATQDDRVAVLRLNSCEQPVGQDIVAARHAQSGPLITRVWKSLGDEIVRSNLIFLGFNTTRLTTATKSLFANRSRHSPRGTDQSQQQSEWLSTAAPAYSDPLAATESTPVQSGLTP